jgi:GT2 family glycosyltransferase/SAM-dependent methyltransferase
MHETALFYSKHFVDTYLKNADFTKIKIVEIGSLDVNGTIRSNFPKNANYTGLDFNSGKGVDVVLQKPYELPFESSSIDVVVCSSCFEHSEFFWLLYLDILRILKRKGIFYLNAPSNGYFHQWPVDCWRFYPDAGHALVSWGKTSGYNPLLLESFIGRHSSETIGVGGFWNDFVAVFLKDRKLEDKYPSRIIHNLNDYRNGYTSQHDYILQDNPLSADFETIIDLKNGFNELKTSLDSKEVKLQEFKHTQQEMIKTQEILNNLLSEKEQLLLNSESNLGSAKNEIDVLLKQLNQEQKKSSEFKLELEKAIGEVNRLHELTNSQKLEIDATLSNLSNLESENESTIINLKSSFEYEKNNLNEIISSLDNKILNNMNEISALNTSLASAKIDISNRNDNIENLKFEILQKENLISELREQQTANQLVEDKLNAELQVIADDLRAKVNSLSQLQSEVGILTSEIKLKDSMLTDLETQVLSSSNREAELIKSFNSLSRILEQKEQTICSMKLSLDTSEEKIIQLNSNAENLRDELNQKTDEIKSSLIKIAELESGLKVLEDETLSSWIKLEYAVDEVKSLQNNQASLEILIQDKDRKIDILTQQAQSALIKFKDFSKECEAMSRSVLDYERRIQSYDMTIGELKKSNSDLAHDLSDAVENISLLKQTSEALKVELNSKDEQHKNTIDSIINELAQSNSHKQNYENLLIDKEAQLANIEQNFKAVINDKDNQLLVLSVAAEQMRAAYKAHVTDLELAVWKEKTALYNFKSMLKPKSILKNSTLSIYKKLPLNPNQRKKIKDFVFSNFSVAFANSAIYNEWKINNQALSVTYNLDLNTHDQSIQNNSEKPMVADGDWEWNSFDNLSKVISNENRKKISEYVPEVADIIDFSHISLIDASSQISFPHNNDIPEITILIPVYNNLRLSLECLQSIAKYTCENLSYEVLVADDCSEDNSFDVLSSIPNLRIIRNAQNLGFLANCNNALPQINGKYLIFLNNDVQVTPGWLESLRNTFDKEDNVGAVGPKFIYPSGHLQEAGAMFLPDGSTIMVGLNDDPHKDRYNYIRRVDYISGACLMMRTELAKKLGGFSEQFLPCYCEDSDLCLRIQQEGSFIYYNPNAEVIHHLSKTTCDIDETLKTQSIRKNVNILRTKWFDRLNDYGSPRLIAFYLPQFHSIPENDAWWGAGFTEWTNVKKAKPNYVGHYQPRIPADLGYYDLTNVQVMRNQAALAKRYGVFGFCFYYYWFDGKRLLETPVDNLLNTPDVDIPYCLCWANENWTRKWDGQSKNILISQNHSADDDERVILDLIKYFNDPRYIKVDGKPLILVYRVSIFPDFKATAKIWREICKKKGVGDIYIVLVESMELVHKNTHPSIYGCDASVEFPPHELAHQIDIPGEILNNDFSGAVGDYRTIALRYATRDFPRYKRFKGVMPGWDNTARMQDKSFIFHNATPGAFQAWLTETIYQTKLQHYGDERLIFINAWNEWAEGAYLEPDQRFGHSYLQAVSNALDAEKLLRK